MPVVQVDRALTYCLARGAVHINDLLAVPWPGWLFDLQRRIDAGLSGLFQQWPRKLANSCLVSVLSQLVGRSAIGLCCLPYRCSNTAHHELFQYMDPAAIKPQSDQYRTKCCHSTAKLLKALQWEGWCSSSVCPGLGGCVCC